MQFAGVWLLERGSRAARRTPDRRPSFNSTPLDLYFGDDPVLEKHYVPAQPAASGVLAFWRGCHRQVFCYANTISGRARRPTRSWALRHLLEQRYGERLAICLRLQAHDLSESIRASTPGHHLITSGADRRTAGACATCPLGWRTVELDVPHRKSRPARGGQRSAERLPRELRQLLIRDGP